MTGGMGVGEGLVPGAASCAPPGRQAQGGGREGAQRPSLGTSTDNPSSRRQERDSRHWFALRDRQPRKVDRQDAAQRQAARDDNRTTRWALRNGVRAVVESGRVQSCGRPGAREDGSVVVRITDATGTAAESSTGANGRVAGLSGLFRCANVWLCPECSLRIAAARAEELATVLSHYLSRGGWAVLVTLTMRHHRRHSLDDCLRAFGKGWTSVTTGGAWQAEKEITDFAGFCRALEVTESPEAGWHVHAHAVIVFNSRPADDLVEKMADGMFGRWSRAVVRSGMPAPLREYGLDVQTLPPYATPEALAEASRGWAAYVAKGLSAEAALGAAKEAKGTNRTIRQLMQAAVIPTRWEAPGTGDIVESVDLTARAKLREYEAAIHGHKQLTWSQRDYDLRKAAGLAEEEPSDEELAAAELEGEDVAVIPRESWPVVEPHAPVMLSVAEREGAPGLHRWLDERGVSWWKPTGLTHHLGKIDRGGRDAARDEITRPVVEARRS
jgi:hypothetical protein